MNAKLSEKNIYISNFKPSSYDYIPHIKLEASPCGVMVDLLDCDIVVSEFELYIAFNLRLIPLGKA